MHHQVVAIIEIDKVSTEQGYAAALSHRCNTALYALYIDGIRRVSFKAQNNCLGRAMARAGGSEGPKEFSRDAPTRAESTFCL